MVFDSQFRIGLTETEERKNEHDNYDQANNVNYSIHDGSPWH
jgi:hypothetical protein